jgi:hypothetical protein
MFNSPLTGHHLFYPWDGDMRAVTQEESIRQQAQQIQQYRSQQTGLPTQPKPVKKNFLPAELRSQPAPRKWIPSHEWRGDLPVEGFIIDGDVKRIFREDGTILCEVKHVPIKGV